MNDKRLLEGTSASTQITGIPAAMAALIEGTSALGSQPTTIMPAGRRAVVCSTAATRPGISTEFGPAMTALTPSSDAATRSAGWSWAVKSGRFAFAESQTYSSLAKDFRTPSATDAGSSGGFSQPV